MGWMVGVAILVGIVVLIGLAWLAAWALVRWASDRDFLDECERRSEEEEWRP